VTDQAKSTKKEKNMDIQNLVKQGRLFVVGTTVQSTVEEKKSRKGNAYSLRTTMLLSEQGPAYSCVEMGDSGVTPIPNGQRATFLVDDVDIPRDGNNFAMRGAITVLNGEFVNDPAPKKGA
jgi:hypothetical protein